MTAEHERGRSRGAFRVMLPVCVVLWLGCAATARADGSGRCLTPAVGQALEGVVKSGALDGILAKDFALERVDIQANTIELEIHDRAGTAYAVALALPESQRRAPDGRGRQFGFFLAAPASQSPQATDALLRAAAVLDAAIPDTAIVECEGQPRRSPLTLALVSAVAAIAAVVAAVLFGLRTVAAMRRPGEGGRAAATHVGLRGQVGARPRSAARKFGLVLLGLVAGLLMTEIALHVADPSLDFHFPTARVTNEQFVRRAGQTRNADGVHYAFDAEGFRIASAPSPPADAPTVLFIGDSFTQGFGVEGEQAFPAQTCERLAQDGIQARCLNAGVTGFGTAHELRLLQMLLADERRRMDAVVFQVLPNNDLHDNWEDGGFAVESGRLVVQDPPHIPDAVRLRQAICDGGLGRSSQIIKVVANAWLGGDGLDAHYDAAAFELERQLLQEVVETAQRRNIPIIIAVCATAWERDATTSQPYDERARLDFVTSVVAALRVPLIDSRTIAKTERDYIPSDGHFSPAGNARMAAAVAEQLAPIVRRARGALSADVPAADAGAESTGPHAPTSVRPPD